MIFLYIDPGTGSMLFSLAVGLAATAAFALRALVLKCKFLITGGKVHDDSSSKAIPYVIFSDHKRYWSVFGPVCDEAEKRGLDVVYYTASEDDPVFNMGYKHITAEYLGSGNKPYARLNFLHATIVLSTTPGLDVYQWKRSKNVRYYVHVPHTLDDLSGYRMFGLDHYDAVLTTGPNQQRFVRKMETFRPSINKKELFNTGSLMMDKLLAKYNTTCRPPKNQMPVILVAPTWGRSGILTKFGTKFLDAVTKTGYQIVVRPHPQSISSEKDLLESLMKKYPEILWNYDNDNFDILDKADILISDFSGIVFEYSFIFDKPVIYANTNFDSSPYDAAWLDEPRWTIKVLPKMGIRLEEKDFGNLKQVIDDAIASQSLREKRMEAKAECWTEIGRSAEKTVDYMIQKYEQLTECKEI